MPDRIEYSIGFSVEELQIIKAQQAIKALEQQLEPFRTKEHFTKLTKELEQFRKEASRPGWFNELQHGIQNVVGEIPVVGQLLNGVFTGASLPLLAFTSALAAMKKGYAEFAETEQKIIALDQALANRNALSPQRRTQLHDQAESVESKTGLKDEQIMGVQARLLQFGAPTSDVEKLTTGVVNLAGALGGDIDRASMIYIRALGGNFTAAHRLGLEIEKTGSASQQMAQLLAESARVGGGALERLHNSSKGAWTDMANEWHKVWTNLGHDLKPIGDGLARVLQGIGYVLNLQPGRGFRHDSGLESGSSGDTPNRIGGGVREQLDDEVQGLATGAGAAKTALDRLIDDLSKLAAMAETIRKAELSESFANIRRDEANGTITKEEAARRAAHAQAESEREAAREAMQNADAQLPLLAEKRQQAEKQLADASAPVEQARADLAPHSKEMADYIGNVNELLPAEQKLKAPTTSAEYLALRDRATQGRDDKGLPDELRDRFGTLANLFYDDKSTGAYSRYFDAQKDHRKVQSAQTNLNDVNTQIQGVVTTRTAAEARLRTADSSEAAGNASAGLAERKRRDKADEDRLMAEADAAMLAAKNFTERRAALKLKSNAEQKAIQDEIDQGHKTAEELKALQAKLAANKIKFTEEDRKLSEQQTTAQDRVAKLRAETMSARAQNPWQQRAALIAERDADLQSLRHQQTAEKDTDKKSEVGAQIDLVTAQYAEKLKLMDQQHIHLEEPKAEVDHFAKIGLFVGGQAPGLNYQQRTAEATGKLAAWVAAGAPVKPTGKPGGTGYV